MFWRRKDSLEHVRQVVSSVTERHQSIIRVSIFGSRSRGDNRRDSDYDFCILTTDDASILDVEAYREDLEDALGRDVDLAFEDYMGDRFRNRISGDLRLIYERT